MNGWTVTNGLGRLSLAAAVVSAAVLLGGCGRSVAQLDRRDRGDPLMRRAEARTKEGDMQSAARLYNAALDSNPKLALAHLQLALLYHDQLKDYILAIYHYRRYQELRGATEKSQMIEDRIRMASQLFAASMSKGDSRSMEKAELERENADLKKTVELRNEELAALRQKYENPAVAVRRQMGDGQTAVTQAETPPLAPSGDSEVQPAAGGGGTRQPAENEKRHVVRTYRVRGGDSLTSIAGQMYGDTSRWPQIYAANRRLLGNAATVKIGQVLVIP